MPDLSLQLLIGGLTLLPLILAYWVGRFVSRRRVAGALRPARPWQVPTLQEWVSRGWLEPELANALPAELSPSVVFFEWARTDPEVARHWRFREPVRPETPFEALVRDVWRNLPEAEQSRTSAHLAKAVVTASEWWGGAERGWNARPFSLLATGISKRQRDLPLLGMDDLTAAPLPGPLAGQRMADEADGVELILALAALRRSRPRFMHPLAPRSTPTGSLLEGMSTQVASDLGRRLGAGFGAALGPIGSMVGQYVGGLAGAMGGKALMQQALPERITNALQETSAALSRLGTLVETDDFGRAVRQPEEAILELGKRVEVVRESRARRIRERFWPTAGLALVEETLRVALSELRGYRSAADVFLQVARKAQEPVAGGMILQNPWLVRSLPGAVERLNGARTTLNRAAGIIRRRPED
jgi:hypothetical protein